MSKLKWESWSCCCCCCCCCWVWESSHIIMFLVELEKHSSVREKPKLWIASLKDRPLQQASRSVLWYVYIFNHVCIGVPRTCFVSLFSLRLHAVQANEISRRRRICMVAELFIFYLQFSFNLAFLIMILNLFVWDYNI
jgi:hypothetical protein